MGKTYLWRTANMSRRTCVVVKQMQSNPIEIDILSLLDNTRYFIP